MGIITSVALNHFSFGIILRSTVTEFVMVPRISC